MALRDANNVAYTKGMGQGGGQMMKALKGLKRKAEAFYVCNTSIVLSGSSNWNPGVH